MHYLLIALAIILSGPIAPFIIIIQSFIKRWKYKKLIKSYDEDYWLNTSEKIKFLENHESYSIIKGEVENIENLIENVNLTADRENISRNSNGNISNRSKRGKTLNKELSSLNELLSKAKSKQSSIRSRIDRLKFKPRNFWEYLKDQYVSYYSYLYTLFFWIFCFYFMVNYFFKKANLALYEMFSYIFLDQEKFIILKNGWGTKILVILITCAILSLIFNSVATSIIKKFIFKKKYPMPPIVSINNYDDY